MATVRVRGARELRRTLREAGVNMRELGKVHRAVGSIVSTAARATAPKVSGKLAASIRPMPAQSRVRIQSRVPYAGPIHWGWPSRGIRQRTFITDSARATEPTWTEVYWAELERVTSSVRGV